ncbi:MAG: hypothetical protein KKG00_07235, partial [Bacteroidetes bacterium]|nr:hypothetical protein [Bacteroidota bacterium]
MQKFRIFTGSTAILVVLMGVTFYWLGKSTRENATDTTINRRKADKFCLEASHLDSLYKTYIAVSLRQDPVLLASTKANLDRQLTLMKTDFA